MTVQDLGYASHFPILAAAIARTTGPVLECGVGQGSTHLIHYAAMGRPILSCETDAYWLRDFIKYQTPTHQFMRVGLWEDVPLDMYRWDVAFVDSSPGEMRVDIVKRLKGNAKYIVCHDTEADIPPAGGNYGWAKLDGLFKYAPIWKEWRPWTTIYSDDEEFKL